MEDELLRIEKGMRGEAVKEMLNAGADVLVQSWQDEIVSHRHIRTGMMYESITKTDVKTEPTGFSITVRPEGLDTHGVRNAIKAYVLHHGRNANKRGRGAIKGSKFVTSAEKNAKEKVDAAMQAALDRFVAGKE